MAYIYPYGDSQQLNLDWFLAKFKELYEYVSQLDPTGVGVITDTQYTPGTAADNGILSHTKNGEESTVMTVDKSPTANSQNPVKSGAVYSRLNTLNSSLNTVENSIAFIVNGKRLQGSTPVSKNQYVLLMNSTISGKADGLYRATNTIPINTDIDGTYLAAVSGGAINDAFIWENGTVTLTAGGGTLVAANTRLLYNKEMHIALLEFQVNASDGTTELTLSIPSSSALKPIYAYNQLTNNVVKCTLEGSTCKIWDTSTLTRASVLYYLP